MFSFSTNALVCIEHSGKPFFPKKIKSRFFTVPAFGFVAGLHFCVLFVYELKNFANNEKI